MEENADLRQLKKTIDFWETRLKKAEGKDAFIIKKMLIEMRKEQYLIKDAFRQPIQPKTCFIKKWPTVLEDKTYLNENDEVVPLGVSLCSPKICSIILCNYSRFKEDSEDRLDTDLHYLISSFEDIATIALAKKPMYEAIISYKIDGLKNIEVAERIQLEYGIKHTPEYISILWRKKIPKLIAEAAQRQWLDWYYLNIEKGHYKKCSRCGQIKLAHNKYFSKNKTSKDNFYSICKECRNKKNKKEMF